MKLTFKLLSIFWMLSPVGFIILRIAGIMNYKFDWLILIVLIAISTFVAFMNYGDN